LATARGFEKVAVAGIVQGWRERLTKTGKKIGFAVLEDLTGARDLVIYEDVIQRYESLLKGDEPVLVRGMVRMAEKFGAEAQQQDNSEPSPEIKVDEVSGLADVRAAKATRVELKLSAEQATSDKLTELKSLFGKYPGSCSASLSIVVPGSAETKIALKGTRVAPATICSLRWIASSAARWRRCADALPREICARSSTGSARCWFLNSPRGEFPVNNS